MTEEGLQARAVRYLHGILKLALKTAVKKGDLPRNPAEFATLPRKNHKAEVADSEEGGDEHVEALDREQYARFLEAARALDWHSALWHVLVTTGLRPGEALALKWRHVDLDNAQVHVRATLARVGHKGWKLTAPKTPKSRRTVPLAAVTVQELQRWKEQQSRERQAALQRRKEQQSCERQAARSAWQDHDFVFTNRHGGPLDHTNLAARCFRRVLERAGLGEYVGPVPEKPKGQPGPRKRRPFKPAFRIYALRHTFASLLLADGVPLLMVSRLLGHSTIKLTADVYGHVLPKERDEVAGHFDRMLPPMLPAG
jgi:integrase